MDKNAKLYVQTGIQMFGAVELTKVLYQESLQKESDEGVTCYCGAGEKVAAAMLTVVARRESQSLEAKTSGQVMGTMAMAQSSSQHRILREGAIAGIRSVEETSRLLQLNNELTAKNNAQAKEIANLRQQISGILGDQCKLEDQLKEIKSLYGRKCIELGELKGAYSNRENELRCEKRDFITLEQSYEKTLARANSLQAALNEARAGLTGISKELFAAQQSIKIELDRNA